MREEVLSRGEPAAAGWELEQERGGAGDQWGSAGTSGDWLVAKQVLYLIINSLERHIGKQENMSQKKTTFSYSKVKLFLDT